MKRVTRYRYDQALELIERARDCADPMVIAVCVRIMRAYRLAHRVPAGELAILDAFAS